MENIPKTVEYFIEAETAGNEVLNLKEEILNLHRRMNEIREALAKVSKSEFENSYMYQGAILMKMDKENIIKQLKNNLKEVNEEIKIKGDEIKQKVYKLQDIEKQDQYKGKNLIPLDKSELKALSQVWGEHS